MKVMTVLGTRPEIIRLCLVIKRLDQLCQHTLVHTGQNYADELSSVFFDELEIRQPDYYLGVRAEGFGSQIGQIMTESEKVMDHVRPDALLVLGDTNSGLVSLIAKRKGIRVFHMEAGNRCFWERVPEEVNRRVIDHTSTVLMPYTQNSKANLLREGIDIGRIVVTGNPIFEVIEAYRHKIEASPVHEQFALTPGRYILATMHREENVDEPGRLADLLEGLARLHERYGFPVVCSLHPRTGKRIEEFKLAGKGSIRFLTPLGFCDFTKLERHAFLVVSDSGTVQEECCIFGVPNVTLREVTERPETIECGSNVLAGTDPDRLLSAAQAALQGSRSWKPPAEYLVPNVSDIVVRTILSRCC